MMLLFRIIHDYFTLICNYCNYSILSLLSEVEVSILWAKQNRRDGQHTEGIMLAKNPSGLIISFGHWHGLVVPGIRTRCSNRRDVSAMNVDGMPWIELGPTLDAFEAQCYWQTFRAVGFPSSGTSTHAVNRFQLTAIFHKWPIGWQLQRHWK